MKLIQLLEVHNQANILAKPTILKYQEVVKLFIRDTKNDNIDITYQDMISWRSKIAKRVKPATCNTHHRHLKALFNTAVKLGHLDKNIFTTINLLKVDKKPNYKIITDQVLDKLTTVIKTDAYYSQHCGFYLTLINVLANTGIRRRQLIGITWGDIDFNNRTLFLKSEFSKNKNSNMIPLKDSTLEYLITLYKKSNNPKNNSQVFNITKFVSSYQKNLTTEEHITQLFRKWSGKIGVKISPHRFRHTFITKLANNGTNLKTVQQIVGHSDIKTTLSYVYADLNDMRKAIDNL